MSINNRFDIKGRFNYRKTAESADSVETYLYKDKSHRPSTMEMELEIQRIFDRLLIDNQLFDESEVFGMLCKYLEKYHRVLYSTLTQKVYDVSDTSTSTESATMPDKFATVMSNLDKLVNYVSDEENIQNYLREAETEHEKQVVFDACKTVIKIWDHVILAHRQYLELKRVDPGFERYMQKSIEDSRRELSRDMISQMLTLVGIFTALSFVLFGGLSSLDNLLNGLQSERLLKLLAIGCVWGIVMIDILFVFLQCVARMTGRKFEAIEAADASFIQRYPLFCWTNYIFLSMFMLMFWFYLQTKGKMETLIVTKDISITMAGGGWLVGICIIIVITFFAMRRWMKRPKDKAQ